MPEPPPLTFTADSIVDTVREPMLVLSADLVVRRANRAFYRTFVVTPEKTIDRSVYDLGDGQWDIPKLRTLLEDVLPQNTSFEDFEVAHDFPSVGRKVMLVNARRLYREPNDTQYILLAFEDVTERRRLEDERRELESRFTSLVKNIRDHSIFTLDPQGRVTSWNREAERILGYGEAEAVGRHFSMIFTPEDRQAGVPGQELATALSEGRAEDERWHMRKNGERFWALGIVTPTQDAGGAHTGYSKILRDMTDRKRAEEALQLADRQKDEFLALLGHELRNPLAPIKNALEILDLKGNEPTAVARARAMIGRQAAQLTRLVDELLDASRVARGKVTLSVERLDLAALVQAAVGDHRAGAESAGLVVEVVTPPTPVWVCGDPARLNQVVTNLWANAVKFTERGGRVTVRLCVEEVPSAEPEEFGAAVLSVSDTGVGIDPANLTTLFQPFRQVDADAARTKGGLGLGLAVVKGLVELHGGRVEAHSAGRGQGATFSVRLPLGAAGTASASDRPSEGPSADGRHVVIIEDGADTAESLGELLELRGFVVALAATGPEGIELCRRVRPDAVVCDLGLPGMTGFDVARALRADPATAGAVLVAVSGYAQDEDRRKASEAGFDALVPKPADTDALARLLATPRI